MKELKEWRKWKNEGIKRMKEMLEWRKWKNEIIGRKDFVNKSLKKIWRRKKNKKGKKWEPFL